MSSQQDDRSFSIVVSFLEVYNEFLYDLLAPPSSGKAPSKRLEVTGSEGTVKGLVERPVTLPSEVLDLLREGQDRRTTASTDWNAQSSRSHCVFMVVSRILLRVARRRLTLLRVDDRICRIEWYSPHVPIGELLSLSTGRRN